MKRFHHDPVCGVRLTKGKAYYFEVVDDEEYLLCCPECQTKFIDKKRFYIKELKRKYEKNKNITKNRI
ncbi:hypothetical protein GF362_03275 [Candidatus Dojkabacteria bacterium]|nr:hypothetical protein [Candidatus Dojkabacteria bacterium]